MAAHVIIVEGREYRVSRGGRYAWPADEDADTALATDSLVDARIPEDDIRFTMAGWVWRAVHRELNRLKDQRKSA